tara:strand:- start:993 stop:2396 length:1404 start_codon:yes stop_codon:yes gene_type:complete
LNVQSTLFAKHALLPTGWARDVSLSWNAQGTLYDVTPGTAPTANMQSAAGPLIPGMPNLHSHAFQRAFAGLTEHRSPGAQNDSFWSWRDLMYRFAGAITPEQLRVIATALYVEMLQAGYTSVCEFHYVHNDVDGRPYADDATLCACLLDAAQAAGIGLTLLPVLYQTSGFGGKAPSTEQCRFIRSTDNMLMLLQQLQPLCASRGVQLGLAPHSLRAVTPHALAQAVAGLNAIDANAPIHIHIAEQKAEVDACLAWSGQRPVQWLLDHVPVDERWCLVHATHMTQQESQDAARSGAIAGICPSTEANLGDGIFDSRTWLDTGGRWGIGSDSHVCVNAAEELMQFEYSQRLALRERNVLCNTTHASIATAMTLAAVGGGAQACARNVGGLEVGQLMDGIALDSQHPALAALPSPDLMLSAHIFASHRTSAIHTVWSSGQVRVNSGQHLLSESSQRAFEAARCALILSSR